LVARKPVSGLLVAHVKKLLHDMFLKAIYEEARSFVRLSGPLRKFCVELVRRRDGGSEHPRKKR
jgi:hypothetical protein